MKHFRILKLTVLAFGLATVAFAAPPSLSGWYQIGGKTLIDPPDDELQDTHFRLFLTGNAARDLYQAMKVRPVKDECLQEGALTKYLGGTACTKINKAYGHAFECSLAINIKSQRVESAYAC